MYEDFGHNFKNYAFRADLEGQYVYNAFSLSGPVLYCARPFQR